MLTKKSYALCNLLFPCRLSVRENDSRSMLDLIVIELAKVLHIHLALINVCNGGEAVEGCSVLLGGLCRTNNVGKLSYARGLNYNTVGGIFLKNLNKRLREIANQRATDASGVHLGDLNTRIGKKTAVNTDLAKLIFNQNQLLTGISFLNHLLNQRGFACAQKSGINIDFCHCYTPSV